MATEGKTAIIVAAITVAGVIVTATFANWDKLIGKKKPDEKTNPVAAAGPSNTASLQTAGSGNVLIAGSNNSVTIAPSSPKPVACRDESHGVEEYARTFEVDKYSSWLGGGFDQAKWCTQVINELRGLHPKGKLEIISSSERSESKCAPLKEGLNKSTNHALVR